jgi:hypothetical protein
VRGGEGGRHYGCLAGRRDLDRLGDHVRPVIAAAEVLRVLVHGTDKLGGKPEAYGLDLDLGLGLNASSGHGPPSQQSSALSTCLGRSKCYAEPPVGVAPTTHQSLQGITAERPAGRWLGVSQN